MANIGYELDELGTNPDNRVTERRILSSKVVDGRCFVVPKVTPFFADGMVITFGTNTLVRDTDYELILTAPEISERLGKDVYGGILFKNLVVNNIVDLDYQTPGGDLNLPLTHTVESLVRIIKNPYYTTFSQITGTPQGLPSFSHIHDWSSVQDFNDLINQLNLIYLALLAKAGSGGNESAYLAALQSHITEPSAHTKEQVGLGNLGNYPLAQYSDFTTTPFTNAKYTTPRSVMYAIELYLGSEIQDLSAKVDELELAGNERLQEWNNLKNSWADLQTTLNSVSSNYNNVISQIQSFQTEVFNINQTYQNVIQNQQTWVNALQDMNDQVVEFQQQYTAFINTRDQLLERLDTLNTNYQSFTQQNQVLQSDVNQSKARLTKLENHTLYPTVRTLTAGTHHFRIPAGATYEILLIGAGGGCGTYIIGDSSPSVMMQGHAGESTSFWQLQNNNGEWIPQSIPIVEAGGGFGGQVTYGNAAGTTITSYGVGGRGGRWTSQSSKITPIEMSHGENGVAGYGNYEEADVSDQETGYDYYGSFWGKGGTHANGVGQGGEGAKALFRFKNTSTKELEYMIVVGSRGRSYEPGKDNALGGLAVITKI